MISDGVLMRFISRVFTPYTQNNKSNFAAWVDVISCIKANCNPFFTTCQKTQYSDR